MNIRDLKENINVDTILAMYPLNITDDDSDEIVCMCPWHEEKNASLFINRTKKVYHCFSCQNSGNMIGFVSEMEHITYRQAADKIAKLMDIQITPDSLLAKGERETIEWLKSQRKKSENVTDVKEASVRAWRSPENISILKETQYWQQTNFPNSVIDFFELGMRGNRISIPIRDEKDKLVGYSTRSPLWGEAQANEGKPKYIHSKGFKKGNYLYNFNNVHKLLQDGQCDIIMLLEGPTDVWASFANGFLKCAAIMGNEVTIEQIDLILRHTYKVCLALDSDSAGKRGMKNFWEKTKNLVDIEWMKLPVGRDVGSLDKQEFWDCYNNKVKV